MKCPLCDEEIEDLVKHFDFKHNGAPGLNEVFRRHNEPYRVIPGVSFTCEACNVKLPSFSALVKHFHGDGHLYHTGQIQEKIQSLTKETENLKQKLAEQTKRTIKAEQDKIEILQAGRAMR